MSIRVGRIMRHEDVHGVSGEGDHKADVFECSDGTCIIRWLGKDGSTNVYGGVKNATNVHGHGGKTEIEWLWEQEADPDPMEAVFDKKIAEANGGPTAPTGATGPTAQTEKEEAEKDAEAEADAEEIVADAEEHAERVSVNVAEKLKATIAEKAAQKAVESLTEENGAEEQD
jgi:hypothetical protein